MDAFIRSQLIWIYIREVLKQDISGFSMTIKCQPNAVKTLVVKLILICNNWIILYIYNFKASL